ncbi:MAG: hypothetical protein K2X77_11595 [Candidatus Obscuribacterales bacterium]|jgi:hypothetical protein|nr:hypothetical protein [Candidatus Obscuribacterales bacterium]
MTEKSQAGKDRLMKQSCFGLLLSSALALLTPVAVFADYAECLDGPSQPTTLRNPLVQGAPYTAPRQIAYGAPLTPGSGSCAPGVIPGDMGGPARVPGGYSDYTHGSHFPATGSQGGKYPYGYVPGAGRYPTQSGYQQGMYDWGQGASYGTWTHDYGSSNAGMGTYEGGYGNYGQRSYDWGQGVYGQQTYDYAGGNGGQWTIDNGAGASGQMTYEGGYGNGGMRRQDNGGGMGGYGTRSYESGSGNGGTWYYSGKGRSGGEKLYENGIGNGGTKQWDGGAGNGGTRTNDNGTEAAGPKINDNGGTRQGSRAVANEGGARSGAEGTQDTLFQPQRKDNKYEFQGPLPTVRTFSRYLVILGVVFATVFVAMASIGVVMGNRGSVDRVIGAVGGLLMLLAGYTIWKVVQMNTFDFNSTGVQNMQRGQAAQRQTQGPVNPPQHFAPPEDPGETQMAPGPGPNQMDPHQKAPVPKYRPQGPAIGHPIGPNLVGSYRKPPMGWVPEPTEQPVINPNR